MTLRNVTRLVFGLFTSIGLIRAASADAHAAATGMFQDMDTNGDDKVSPGEHAAGARKMFETMDANGDGKVTAAEMTAANDTTKSHKADATEMSSADKIKVIDTNGDGMLSAQEHAAGATMMFDKMDTNHDGSLTASEFAAGHAKMMPKRSK